MLGAAAARFYKTVRVAAAEEGHTVTLDGRPVKTPGGSILSMPTKALAKAVAGEWRAQESKIRPHTMPLTQLLVTAIDRVARERRAVIGQVVGYAGTDLVCYRAEYPPDLVERQQTGWQPLLAWLEQSHKVRLEVTSGIVPVAQSRAALDALNRVVEAMDDFELTALAGITAACGSLVIALALVAGHIDAETAYELSQLDESHQIERWGEDPEATARRAGLRADIAAAARFLDMMRA
jgi:chaperone required for assembly of F1-ATPase